MRFLLVLVLAYCATGFRPSFNRRRLHRAGRTAIARSHRHPITSALDTEDPPPPVLKFESVTPLRSTLQFESAISTNELTVVKFYAPWCRACKAMGPKFKKVAQAYEGRAAFYEVSFADMAGVCKKERIMALPSIHIYHSTAGRLEKVACKFTDTREKVSASLDHFLEPDVLSELRGLTKDTMQPVILLRQLLSAWRAFQKAPSFYEKFEVPPVERLSTDQKEEIQALFQMLDRNKNGTVGVMDIASIAAVLGKETSIEEIAQMVTYADNNMETHEVDAESFLNMMSMKVQQDNAALTKENDELRRAFELVDEDGTGFVPVGRIRKICDDMRSVWQDGQDGEAQVDNTEYAGRVERLLATFDINDDGHINYEEFVSMLT